MRQKLTLVTLGVNDFQRSLKFYQDGLGWKRSSGGGDDTAFFQMGGIVLSLYPREKLAEDAMVSATGSGFSGITLAFNAKSEAEVDQVLRNAASVGAKIVKHGQKAFWGGYSGYFSDPDGHLWEVAWNPYWDFDENDSVILPE